MDFVQLRDASGRDNPATVESPLLALAGKARITREDEAAIRTLLSGSVDWTEFARQAVDRGIAGRAGHTLLRIAPTLIPADIRDALRAVVDRARTANEALLADLRSAVEESGSAALGSRYAAAERALTASPSDAAPWRALGGAFFDLDRLDHAVACYDQAIRLAPDDAHAWRDRGGTKVTLRQHGAALADLDEALALDPNDSQTWALRAHALCPMERIPDALEACDRALALDPGNIGAQRARLHALLFACDWDRRGEMKRRIADALRAGAAVVTPFNHLAISESEADNLALARIWARGVPPAAEPLWSGERYRHDKVRVAYLSTDFRTHAVSDAMIGCFEHHDKRRFETIAISLGQSDGSKMRLRVEAAFDRFIDARIMSDAGIAALIRELEVDIAIDLNGYAGNRRSGILARRPAPVQANYLGYAGTLGMPFVDYIIADRTVIPEEHLRYYSEKVVYLPYTFFPTDRNRRIADRTPTRAEVGLPKSGFVFTCQSTAYKITPELFDVWMRLLRTIDGSVLWLAVTDSLTSSSLRREAERRGVAPDRLFFSTWVAERADHLARLRLADLFLDTLPYNAHATACDALWAGLPLLTCRGNTFPSRVAASLLGALDMPELVTDSLDEYEAAAMALATDPKRLRALRAKLARNRDSQPLFDTVRFTCHLEAALIGMWERHQAGLPPDSFAVSDNS